MNLTEDQILALAPDESSKKAGKDLSNPAKWVSKGVNEQAIWGECQGSGSKPYQTQVDLGNLAFKCSCPSRKFPCKHGLGLLLLHSRHASSFAGDAPAWVTEWLQKRAEKEEKAAEKKDKPVDEVAQAKRLKAREQSVEDGMEELLQWIKDIVRNGILNIPEKGPAFFSGMAKRMIDAKAPGLAGMINILGNTGFYAEGWQGKFMDQLARIYLVISGFKNSGTLPEALAEDIRSFTGFTQNQEALKEQKGITDHWLVLGKQTTEEENVTTERNWLYGAETKRYALVLQFSVRGQGISFSLTPGMVIQAELNFFPSVAPYRAIIKRQISSGDKINFTGFNNWQEVLAEQTNISAALPFQSERSYIINNIKLVQHDHNWWMADADNQLINLKKQFKGFYTLLAVSGGEAMKMALVGREDEFEPIGVWNGEQYLPLIQ